MKFLVINGPNLNMLGIREPGIYGSETYEDLTRVITDAAVGRGVDVEIFQHNHAAYTHTSVAILDALKAVAIPAVEVHISDVSSREEFRQISYVRLACIDTFAGFGFDGYVMAMDRLIAHLKD